MGILNPVFVVLQLLEFRLVGLRVAPGVLLILGLEAVEAFVLFLAVLDRPAKIILFCAEVEADCFVLEVGLKGAGPYKVSERNGVTFVLSTGIGLCFKALDLRSKVAHGLEGLHIRILCDAILPRSESRRLDFSLELVDDLGDIVFAQVKQVPLRWQLYEGMDDVLAVAHEIQQFDVVISVAHPHLILADPVQPRQPVVQPDPHMLVGVFVVVASGDLHADQLILHVLSRPSLLGDSSRHILDGVAL